VVVADNRVLLGSRSYDLIALDADTGSERWKRYYWFSWIESPPVVRDGVVYTGSSDATNVYAIDLGDGSLRWKSAVPGYSWQRVAVDGDLLITGTLGKGAYPSSRNGSLLALDRDTGAIRWLYLDPPSAATVKAGDNWGFAASPVIGAGVVHAADFSGRVFAFAIR
jgi:outer membrane protein assembly factor BamB